MSDVEWVPICYQWTMVHNHESGNLAFIGQVIRLSSIIVINYNIFYNEYIPNYTSQYQRKRI